MRIFVAEDHAALASFVKNGMEAEHYTVDIAPDGHEANCVGGAVIMGLILLHLNLPRLDGRSVLRCVRLKKPSLPVLVATGRSRIEHRVQALDAGADQSRSNHIHSANCRRG